MVEVDLSTFKNEDYQPGSFLKRSLWYLASAIFVNSFLPWPYSLKTGVLRLFGAQIGKGAVVKPYVKIKYPWFLKIGDDVWIGEGVWIDNLTMVTIESNVCISQGSMLLTGNHDYKKKSFDLMVEGIHVERGAWVGAKSVVCPGVRCGSHSVLTVGSIATHNLDPYYLYTGNPAEKRKKRDLIEG